MHQKLQSLVSGKLRRAAAVTAATVLFVGIGSTAIGALGASAGAATAQKVWPINHRPHFIHPAFIAESSNYMPLHVPVVSKDAAAVSALAVTSSGQVTGGLAKPAATPETIPTGTTFTVNSTADVYAKTTSSKSCSATVTGKTVCTLRAAVQAAANLGEDTTTNTPSPATIVLPAGSYTLKTGELWFYSLAGVTVDGAGAGTTTIKSTGDTRVALVTGATPLALNGVTLTGGVANQEETPGVAPKVHPHSQFTPAACGGGIFQPDPASVLELDGVTVTKNTAQDAGGGICASGTVYASASSITDNTVLPNPVIHECTSECTSVSNTLSDTGIDALGGGLVLGYDDYGSAIFNGVTVSGNTVDTSKESTVEDWFGAGGGVAALYGSYLTLQNSTVSANTVTSGSADCANTTTHTHFCGVLAGGGLFDIEANVSASGTSFNNNNVDKTSSCGDYCEYGAIGGGIANFGGTNFTGITVDGNSVSTGTPGNTTMNSAEGGGIDTYDPMVLTNSTIDDNTALGADDADDNCSISGGGGIFAGSTGFVMSGTTVSGNKVVDGDGGGVIVWSPDSYNEDTPLTGYQSGDVLTDDSVTDNSSLSSWSYTNNPQPSDFGSGGGLFVEDGEIQVTGLTIDGNTAATWSGGLWASNDTTAHVSDTTVADNTAYQGGGVTLTYGASLDATNSTIADNQVTGTTGDHEDTGLLPGGGGIYIADTDSGANLAYDTISGNSAATTGGGIYVSGEIEPVTCLVAGAGCESFAAVKAVGTIIAGNVTSGTDAEQDCSWRLTTKTVTFPLTSGGWNLAGDASCNLTQTTDQYSVAADLGPLANNGGPAPTMEPNIGSPAVTAGGGAPTCPATDERGVPRPQGKYCDVGAVEVNAGYWLVGADGGVFALGGAPFYGAATGTLPGTGVGIAATPNGGGYWVVTSEGGVSHFGDAGTYGSMLGKHLNAPVVGIVGTADGKGYWLVAADGGVFDFGDAGFFTSDGNKKISAPIVGMAATPTGGGYWLVGSDGNIYPFGNAKSHTSEYGKKLAAPVVGMAGANTGGGYWLAGADGGVFSFGSAVFHTCWAGKHLDAPIVGMSAAPGGMGYWLAGADGGVFSFGTAPFEGSLPSYGVTAHDITGITTA
jgi:hypothetical protein